MKTNKRVKRFYSIWANWYSPISRSDINPYDNSREYDMSFHNESVFVDKYKFVAAQDIQYNAHLLDDEDFNALCKKNGIDYKKYYSPDKDGSIKTIVMNTIDRNGEPIFKITYSAKLSAHMALILKRPKEKISSTRTGIRLVSIIRPVAHLFINSAIL